MRTLRITASAAALLLVLSAIAQDRPRVRPGEEAIPARPGDAPATDRRGGEEGFYRASEVLGAKVSGEGGEELGTIQDLLIDRRSQRISHFILGEEGEKEITAQSNLRIVPWTVARPRFTQQERIVTVPMAPQRFREAPVYTWQDIQTGPRGGWYTDVNRFYGVRPGPGGFGPGGRVEFERDGDVEIEGDRGPRRGRVEIDND